MENIQADHRVGLEPRGGKRRRRRTDSAVFRQFLSNYLRGIYGEDTVPIPRHRFFLRTRVRYIKQGFAPVSATEEFQPLDAPLN